MRIDCFLDTNVLIYAAAGKHNDPRKFDIARGIVAGETFGLSAQVLAEFYANVTKKPAIQLSSDVADRWVDLLCRFPLAAVDQEIVQTGIRNSRFFQISYWDGAIIAAAERLGAPVLYTEDLSDGQIYGSVRVVNPFRQN